MDCNKPCPANPTLLCESPDTPAHIHLKRFAASPQAGVIFEYYWEDNATSIYWQFERNPSTSYGWHWERKTAPTNPCSELESKSNPVQEPQAPVEVTDWDLLPDPEFNKPLMTWEEFLKVRP